jgi:hypothetical protein
MHHNTQITTHLTSRAKARLFVDNGLAMLSGFYGLNELKQIQ